MPGGDLLIDSAEHVALFDEVLVFGEAALPPTFATWQEVQRAGAWRKIRRTAR